MITANVSKFVQLPLELTILMGETIMIDAKMLESGVSFIPTCIGCQHTCPSLNDESLDVKGLQSYKNYNRTLYLYLNN